MRSYLRLRLVALGLLALNILLFSQLGLAETTVATTASLDGYTNLLSIELRSGALNLFETPRASNFAISIDMKGSPLCKTEVVADPVRVLIDCPGRILQGTRPITLPNSKMAKRVRFGYSGDSSKIVIDMNVDVFSVQAPEQDGDRSLFVYGGKGQDWATPTPNGGETAVPVVTAAPKATAANVSSDDSTPGPVYTPVPLPKIEFGETDMLSLSFTRNQELNSPVIKISLRAGRKVELKRSSPTVFVLSVAATRLFSPIFTQPQMAPDGLEPFRQALISEVITSNSPVGLSIKIDLTRPADLQVKQSGGDVEVFEQAEALEN